MNKTTNENISSKISFASPTESIIALTNKLSLCMLMLGYSLLFFQAEFKKYPIALLHRKVLALSLIVMSCVISAMAIYEYELVMDKYIVFCRKTNVCLYDINMIYISKYVYLTISLIFTVICFYLTYLMISVKSPQ
jgi:hypothetical protein